MDRNDFLTWLSEADRLTETQRDEAVRVLAEPASLASVLQLLEDRIDERRCCPHCQRSCP